MAETLITAPAVPKKVFIVGVLQKDEVGSAVEILFRTDVIAVSAEAAKAVALGKVLAKTPNVDLSRVGFSVGEVAFT